MPNNSSLFSYFETPPILQKLMDLPECEWKDKTFLKKNNNSYLRAKLIPLIGDDWKNKDVDYVKEKYAYFEKEITDLHNYLLSKFKKGYFNRCLIVLLPSQTVITSHIDDESVAGDFKRFLIPIITYPEVFYDFGDESKELAANEMWEINSNVPFSVRNYSHTRNIHITVDWNIEA
jgi:hypothetical protein